MNLPIDITSPNMDLFFTVWGIATFSMFIMFPPAGLGAALLKFAVIAAVKIAVRRAPAYALKTAAPAYLVACLQFGSGDGSPGSPSSPPEIPDPEPPPVTFVAIHFDNDLLNRDQLHVRIDDRLLQEPSVDSLLEQMRYQLVAIYGQGRTEAIFHLNPYPGPDLERRIASACRDAGFTLQQSESPWGTEFDQETDSRTSQ